MATASATCGEGPGARAQGRGEQRRRAAGGGRRRARRAPAHALCSPMSRSRLPLLAWSPGGAGRRARWPHKGHLRRLAAPPPRHRPAGSYVQVTAREQGRHHLARRQEPRRAVASALAACSARPRRRGWGRGDAGASVFCTGALRGWPLWMTPPALSGPARLRARYRAHLAYGTASHRVPAACFADATTGSLALLRCAGLHERRLCSAHSIRTPRCTAPHNRRRRALRRAARIITLRRRRGRAAARCPRPRARRGGAARTAVAAPPRGGTRRRSCGASRGQRGWQSRPRCRAYICSCGGEGGR